MMICGNRYKKIEFCFKVHSFKHLYNNYRYCDLYYYVFYLKTIYFNVYSKDYYILFADKSCLIRSIIELEKELLKLTDGGFNYGK